MEILRRCNSIKMYFLKVVLFSWKIRVLTRIITSLRIYEYFIYFSFSLKWKDPGVVENSVFQMSRERVNIPSQNCLVPAPKGKFLLRFDNI